MGKYFIFGDKKEVKKEKLIEIDKPIFEYAEKRIKIKQSQTTLW